MINSYSKEQTNPADLIPTKQNGRTQGQAEIDDSQLAATWTRRLGF